MALIFGVSPTTFEVGPILLPHYVSKWINATLFVASLARLGGVDEIKLKLITSATGPQIRWFTYDAIPKPPITTQMQVGNRHRYFTEQARNLVMSHEFSDPGSGPHPWKTRRHGLTLVSFQSTLPCDTTFEPSNLKDQTNLDIYVELAGARRSVK